MLLQDSFPSPKLKLLVDLKRQGACKEPRIFLGVLSLLLEILILLQLLFAFVIKNFGLDVTYASCTFCYASNIPALDCTLFKLYLFDFILI